MPVELRQANQLTLSGVTVAVLLFASGVMRANPERSTTSAS